MKALRTMLLALGMLTLVTVSTSAQAARKPRLVIMDDYIRAILIKDWDAHLHDKIKLERAYCLRWQYDIWAGEKAYRVTQIFAPDSVDADEHSIYFVCPKDADIAELHVHPQQTCVEDRITGALDCWDGGPYAWQCLPSDDDRERTKWLDHPFDYVQCTREGVVFYFAAGDKR